MKFNIVNLPTEIDPSFEKVYFENNPMASKDYLPHIYNYYLHFGDRINLPGNIASTPFGVNSLFKRSVSIKNIKEYYGVQKYDYVKDYYQKWMNECSELCQNFNIDVLNLYYWEEKMANWGGQIALDKDLAQDEISPLNSRLLIETVLSVPLKYRNIPDKKLHQWIIKRLWPELLTVPTNPSLKNTIKQYLVYFGLFNTFSKLQYRFLQKH